MKKSHSSKQWLRRHVNDPYVQRSKREGYRSRSAYKLTEIDERDRLFRPGQVVLDLGAAPGGWTQVAVKRDGERRTVPSWQGIEACQTYRVDRKIKSIRPPLDPGVGRPNFAKVVFGHSPDL